jgi:CRISPR-associated protein Cmr1
MNTLIATYRVVTPMFLGGADPLREAELRVPSFKGALRFWWRALRWGEVKDVVELRQREAELFGSSETGQSRILLRMDSAHRSSLHMDKPWARNSWEQYTGYGLREKENGERCFISAGREWTITLNLKRCDLAQSAQVLAALKLLGLVGGLGSRSRKGWGSIVLSKLDGADWRCPSDGATWSSTVESLFQSPLANDASLTAFTQDARWNAGPIQTSAAGAQKWVGENYQKLVKNTMPKSDRAQFGLPRKFGGGDKPQMDRRASPLFLHVHDCCNGKALPVALWLPSNFLPDATHIPGNGTSARRFVETLSSTPTATIP